MHVTTRIEGRKHEGLLEEKGFQGFPSLAFMDAEGEIVAEPQGRDTASFEATLEGYLRHEDLKKRIEAGEKGLDADLLLAEYALGKVEGDDFKTRAAALEKVSEKHRAAIDQILVDEEISELAQKARRNPGALEEASTAFLKMLEEGKRPSKSPSFAGAFWVTIGRHGLASFDPAACRTAAKGLKEDLSDNPNVAGFIEHLNEMADRMDSLADLTKRREGGEEGLEVEILLVEHELGKTKDGEFKDRATPLLEKATEEQRAKLEAALREVAFRETLQGARGGAGLEGAAAALLKLLEAGDPPKEIAGQVWGLLSHHARNAGDADLIEKVAAGIRRSFADDERAQSHATMLEGEAKKLRAEKAKAGEKKPEDEKADDDEPGDGNEDK